VAVPEVSTRKEVNEARKGYEQGTRAQWLLN
jgi:TPP-dependent trihydroxycyclohexane-1,2-dione (THcHDO) dehydratase